MSTTPRKSRSDKERRRLARIHGLEPSATWSEVEARQIEHAAFVRMAESYGQDENATWDDIYAALRNEISEGKAATRAARAAMIAASPLLLLLLVWTNWVTIVVAIGVFVVVFALMFWGYGLENSEHVEFMLRHTEIKERARRDGLFGLNGDN